MNLEIINEFFRKREVKYFLIFSFICYITFILLSMVSDIDYHKKKKKDKKNKLKLESQKQKFVSESDI